MAFDDNDVGFACWALMKLLTEDPYVLHSLGQGGDNIWDGASSSGPAFDLFNAFRASNTIDAFSSVATVTMPDYRGKLIH